MFDRTIDMDPRPAAPPNRNNRMRNGHRREYAADRERGSISFRNRCSHALACVGVRGWPHARREDPRDVRWAAADAQKISNFCPARSCERQAEREATPVATASRPGPAPAAGRVLRPEIPLPSRSFGPSR